MPRYIYDMKTGQIHEANDGLLSEIKRKDNQRYKLLAADDPAVEKAYKAMWGPNGEIPGQSEAKRRVQGKNNSQDQAVMDAIQAQESGQGVRLGTVATLQNPGAVNLATADDAFEDTNAPVSELEVSLPDLPEDTAVNMPPGSQDLINALGGVKPS